VGLLFKTLLWRFRSLNPNLAAQKLRYPLSFLPVKIS
jgi:hypothetical protein